MQAQELIEFLDLVKDMRGYLTALVVNFTGTDEKVAIYLDYLRKVGDEDLDPVEFYEMLLELRAVLGVLVTGYPETGGEVLPLIQVIDDLRNLVRM